jgi:hypothetical protein
MRPEGDAKMSPITAPSASPTHDDADLALAGTAGAHHTGRAGHALHKAAVHQEEPIQHVVLEGDRVVEDVCHCAGIVNERG